MIANIIDNRRRPYRWRCVNANIEAVEHDNSCQDSDQAAASDPAIAVLFAERKGISVEEAVRWAIDAACPVTLYIQDC